jgi:small-conductance mechanosensitive channel
VSGLILLIERPVKVGDWVTVGEWQGFVKNINVRAIELETFTLASVIIPNADLISNAVTNWTHKDTRGRIDVVVRAPYGTDTTRIQEILLDCAHRHPLVLSRLEPYVLFQEFGASGLEFELRCYTADVVKRLSIASDIRHMINRRFNEEGIERPLPQQVLHFADAGLDIRTDRQPSRRENRPAKSTDSSDSGNNREVGLT